MFTVIESTKFEAKARQLLSQAEYEDFIDYIAEFPASGEVIPGAHGLRKVRWKAQGKGKRGGVRIIYICYTAKGEVFLLDIYAKSDKTDLTPKERRKLQ